MALPCTSHSALSLQAQNDNVQSHNVQNHNVQTMWSVLPVVVSDFAGRFLKKLPPAFPAIHRPIMQMYKKFQPGLACSFNCCSKENIDYMIFLQTVLSAQTDVQSNNPRITKKAPDPTILEL